METTEPWPLRWNLKDYYRLCHEEWFLERRVQLIGGEIWEFGPSHDWHEAGVALTQDELRKAFGAGYWVRVHGSLDWVSPPCPIRTWPSSRVLHGNIERRAIQRRPSWLWK